MAELWTNSRLRMRQTCPMKEKIKYLDQLAPIGFNQALSLGSAIHKGLETRSIEEALKVLETYQPNNQDEADKLEVAMCTAEAALSGYFEHYKPFENAETEVGFKLRLLKPGGATTRLHWLAGKIDAIDRRPDGDWIVEYKTASRLDAGYFDRLYVDSQITTYMYAAKRMGYNPRGVIYRIIRKPQLRRKQGESVGQFTARLTEDYKARPEFYFMERELYRSTADLNQFEAELWYQASLAHQQHKKGVNIRHTGSCAVYGACEYLPICTNQAGWEAMFETRKAHEELEEEA